MKLLKTLFFACLSIALAGYSYATSTQSEGRRIMCTLKKRLAKVDTPKDSILLLVNMFDISQRDSTRISDSLAQVTYEVAVRAGDDETALDMIRQRANFHLKNDSMLAVLRQMALRHPKNDIRSATVTFIDILENSYASRQMEDDEREVRLHDQLYRISFDMPDDIYERISLLHGVCANIAQTSQGNLYSKYMEQLGELIDQLPSQILALRNAYFVQSAIGYAAAGKPDKSIEADKHLLVIMDSLERHYSRLGRPYRNYDAHRYVVYTRLLSNWKNLTPDEIETFYANAIKYGATTVRANSSYKRSPRADIHYAMAHQDYSKAMPLIQGSIELPENKPYKKIMLKYLIECAQALGDTDVLLAASTEYTKLLENCLSKVKKANVKELQIANEIYDMKKHVLQLENAEREAKADNQRTVIIISLIFIVLLILLLFQAVRYYRKAKKLAATLADSNHALSIESRNLRQSQVELTHARDKAQKSNNFKTDFIKNMSREVSIPLRAVTEYSHLIVDCAESEGKPYLERYADLVELNCTLLNSIVNDVLHLTEIESDSVNIRHCRFDIYTLVSLCVDTASIKLPKNLEIVFDSASPRLEVHSDQRRVQQIIMNLLSNAIKFTPSGKIRVSYDLAADKSHISITVTDTGIGIPREQAENIFERFVKLDKETQGVGLGLTISRMLARLLGGNIILDTGYTHGARFIFTLPCKNDSGANHSMKSSVMNPATSA